MRMKWLKLNISQPRKESSLETNKQKRKPNTSNENIHCVDKYCEKEFSAFKIYI